MIMRICKIKATKQVIEMQSAATEGTLLKNAISAGYAADDVEENVVDAAGYAAALAEDPVYIANQEAAAAVIKAKAEAVIKISELEAELQKANTIAALKVIVLELINCIKVLT